MTEKVKLHEIAEELGISSKDVVKAALYLNIDVKAANSNLTMEDADALMKFIMSEEEIRVVKPSKENTKELGISSQEDFKKLVTEIHRVNRGWHSFEISNRFLGIDDKYFEDHYRKKKNQLQKTLIEKFSDMIDILPEDETGFQSISIKEQYMFDKYKDACHKL